MHASIFTESNTLPPLIIISRVHFMNLEATPLSALDSLTRRSISINIPLQPNVTCPQTCMQAFFTESNTLPPLIIISRVHFMNLEATPLSALDSLLEGVFLLIFHCNKMLRALKHACKHFYRIQHSPTFNYHQPRPLHEFGSHTPFGS